MTALIESLVFLVFGIIIIAVGLITDGGINVLVLGGLITLTSILFLIVNKIKKK